MISKLATAVLGRVAVASFAEGPATCCPVALSAIRKFRTSAVLGATKDDVLSSGKAPSATPPDDPAEFQRFADLYIGGIWKKIEAGLGQMQGESFDCNVEMEGGRMRVMLPGRSEISVRKEPHDASLVVNSNLHDFYGSYDSDNEVSFQLKDGQFEAHGEALHSYLEDALAKHLKIQVDLEPDVDTTYGPDPT